MNELEPNDQELAALIEQLGELGTPEIPTALAERIDHALAVEAAARPAPATAGAATATSAATSAAATAATAPSLDELAQRRAAASTAGSPAGAPRSSRRTKVLGAVAGIAAVGVFGFVGVQALDSNNPGDLSAGNGTADRSAAAEPGGGQVSYAETPVIATGTTFTQAALGDQVQQQLPKWKRASQLVQVSPNAINDIDMDGTADPTTGAAASRMKLVTNLRERLLDCLANIDRENVTPLVVDLAELRDESNANPQNVAVVALPQDQGAPQESANYEVYFVGPECNRQNTDVVAQLTVANDGSN